MFTPNYEPVESLSAKLRRSSARNASKFYSLFGLFLEDSIYK